MGWPNEIAPCAKPLLLDAHERRLADNLWAKVQGWIVKCMVSSGKEILIKAIAQAIPTYSMSCFLLPRGLCNQVNTMLWNFLGGCKDGKRKTVWISWEDLTMPKYMGGLGFRDAELFNLAMLAKHGWRILQEPSSLSARILKAKYFPSSNLQDVELGSQPQQVWRAVHAGLDVLKQGLIRRKGNVETTHVWNQNWIPRSNLLRTLHPVSNNPHVLVAELIDSASRRWNWEAIYEHMNPVDADAIMNIPLSTSVSGD